MKHFLRRTSMKMVQVNCGMRIVTSPFDTILFFFALTSYIQRDRMSVSRCFPLLFFMQLGHFEKPLKLKSVLQDFTRICDVYACVCNHLIFLLFFSICHSDRKMNEVTNERKKREKTVQKRWNEQRRVCGKYEKSFSSEEHSCAFEIHKKF